MNLFFKIKGVLVLVVLVGLDQLSKYLVVHYNLLSVYYNRDVAFSLQIPWYLPWLIAVGAVGWMVYKFSWGTVLRYMYEFIRFEYPYWLTYGVMFVVAGGISNVIDRLYRGAVVDFIDLKVWPIFNLADTFIVCGVVMCLYYMYSTRSNTLQSQQ